MITNRKVRKFQPLLFLLFLTHVHGGSAPLPCLQGIVLGSFITTLVKLKGL